MNVLGRTLITAGVLILLFVVYQLWGTGIREAQAQDRLEQQFKKKLAPVDGDNTTGGSATSPSTSSTGDTVTTETLPATTVAAEPAPPEGDAIGKIEIQK